MNSLSLKFKSSVRAIYADFTPEKGYFFSLSALWLSMTFSNALTEITFIFSLVFWFWVKARRKSLPLDVLPARLAGLMLAFAGVVLLSCFWSEVPKDSFRGLFKILQRLATFAMVLDLTPAAERKFTRNVFIPVFFLLIINSFWQYLVGVDFLRFTPYQEASSGPRISAAFKTYGQLSAFLILTIPAVWTLGSKLSKLPSKERLLSAILFLSGLVCLFLTRSRGAMIAFFTAVVFVLVLRKYFKQIMLLTCVLLVGLLFVPKSMIIHFDIENREQSLVERYYLWERAFQVIEAKPLTGTGINTYLAAHAKYDKKKRPYVTDYYVHNGYLQRAAEIGIPGILIFLSFLFLYGLWCWRGIKATPDPADKLLNMGLWTGIAAFLVLSLVDTSLDSAQSALPFWFIMGLIGARLTNGLEGSSNNDGSGRKAELQ